MEINTGYKIAIECFIKEILRKKHWIYGDRVVEKFTKNFDIELKWECVEIEKNDVRGFENECSGLGLNATGWYGTKDGAKRIASWKWIQRLFETSGADMKLYWSAVKRFAKEVIDVGDICGICGSAILIEGLWDHVEECVIDREREFFESERKKIEIECGICEQSIKLDLYRFHLVQCKMKRGPKFQTQVKIESGHEANGNLEK